MDETITYARALFSMAAAMQKKAVDAFTASYILAIMFSKEKEKTIEDLVDAMQELEEFQCG
jgi:hypothetical protein